MSEEWRLREAVRLAIQTEDLQRKAAALADSLKSVDFRESLAAADVVVTYLRPLDLARMALDLQLAVDHLKLAVNEADPDG